VRTDRPTAQPENLCALCLLRVLRDSPLVFSLSTVSPFPRAEPMLFSRRKRHPNNIPYPAERDSAPLCAPGRTVLGTTPSGTSILRPFRPTGLIGAPRCITKQQIQHRCFGGQQAWARGAGGLWAAWRCGMMRSEICISFRSKCRRRGVSRVLSGASACNGLTTNDINPVTARSVSDEAVSATQLGIAASACGLLAMTRSGVITIRVVHVRRGA
jgi:hypothetical protein